MKTNKLELDYDYDFEFIGMISSLKGHKLAWDLNKEMNILLKKEDDIKLSFLNDASIVIVSYKYTIKYSYFRLIKNKSTEFTNIASPFLLPELKEYDYFIQVGGEGRAFESEGVMLKLKNISGVEFTKYLEVENLKSKDNLIF
jgi:hypothetical protein